MGIFKVQSEICLKMDKIFFQNLRFYGYHGVFQHEKLRGQYFELDIELSCELESAGRSGQIESSIDYCALYQFVKMIVTERNFNLLEELGNYICEKILERFTKVENIILRLRKPEAPLENGIISDQILAETMFCCLPPWKLGYFGSGGSVGIELHRSRQAQ